jgi:GNAT superfamily N-acetyltransferase
MKFRQATDHDCALLAILNQQLIEDEHFPNAMTASQLEARMRDWIEGDYTAMLFFEAHAIVAYAVFREEAYSIHLRQFFVQRAERRKGIGRQAFATLRNDVWPVNKRVTVDVLLENAEAVAFWHALGFDDYYLGLQLPPRSG